MATILIAIEWPEIRRLVVTKLTDAGMKPEVLVSVDDAQSPSRLGQPLIVGTDDIGALRRTVTRMYELSEAVRTLPVVVLLSESVLANNPDLSTWIVDGHAALSTIITPDFENIIRIPTFLRRLGY